MADPRFTFYEIVRVRNTPKNRSCRIAGLEGAIMGITPPDEIEEGQELAYSVFIDAVDSSWALNESELEPTGRKARREDFHDGTSIRVSRDGRLLG
jgi:hypothetical protein